MWIVSHSLGRQDKLNSLIILCNCVFVLQTLHFDAAKPVCAVCIEHFYQKLIQTDSLYFSIVYNSW